MARLEPPVIITVSFFTCASRAWTIYPDNRSFLPLSIYLRSNPFANHLLLLFRFVNWPTLVVQLISRDTNDLGGFVISKLILKYRRNRLTFLAWLRFYQGLFLSSMLNFLRTFSKKEWAASPGGIGAPWTPSWPWISIASKRGIGVWSWWRGSASRREAVPRLNTSWDHETRRGRKERINVTGTFATAVPWFTERPREGGRTRTIVK